MRCCDSKYCRSCDAVPRKPRLPSGQRTCASCRGDSSFAASGNAAFHITGVLATHQFGLTENRRPKNDRPSRMAWKWRTIKILGVKMQDMKMQDLQLQDQFVFSVTAKYFRSNHRLTVYITELKLEFKHHNYELKRSCTRPVLPRLRRLSILL